jgi:F-type H+-transporting ATPase subunit epsilon
MLPDSIQLIIVTPERQLLRETVVEVTLPGADGQLGILPGHAPLITELGIGELNLRTKSGDSVPIAIISGFAEVLGERVTVLAETAERPEEIDLARAEEAKKRAEQRLAAAASTDPDIDWSRAAIALQRSLIRIQVARKRHSVMVPGE